MPPETELLYTAAFAGRCLVASITFRNTVGPDIAHGYKLLAVTASAFGTICFGFLSGHDQFVKFLAALGTFEFINRHLLLLFGPVIDIWRAMLLIVKGLGV